MHTSTRSRLVRASVLVAVSLIIGAFMELSIASVVAWADPEIRTSGWSPNLRVEGTNFALARYHTRTVKREIVTFSEYEPFAMMDKIPDFSKYTPQRPSPWTTQYMNRLNRSGHKYPYRLDTFAFGWPLPCMTCARCYTGGPPLLDGVDRRSGRFEIYRAQAFPYGIHLPSLALDAALLAPIPLLLILALQATRRRYRRHRNLCLHCAYDLSATLPSLPCPECGKPSPVHTVPTV